MSRRRIHPTQRIVAFDDDDAEYVTLVVAKGEGEGVVVPTRTEEDRVAVLGHLAARGVRRRGE